MIEAPSVTITKLYLESLTEYASDVHHFSFSFFFKRKIAQVMDMEGLAVGKVMPLTVLQFNSSNSTFNLYI
jgi:hypothetical protein